MNSKELVIRTLNFDSPQRIPRQCWLLPKEYVEIAHHYGKYVFMHSDGDITEIIADLIETGIDALNSQLFCMDITELGKKFSGKITFWGEIDRQSILPNGNKTDIEDA